jgi:hypothetical protein
MSTELELNENMTSEEIASYADAVAKEVEQERMGERKSDAEIVADTSSATETSADDNSSSEPVDDDSSVDNSGDKSALPKWVNDKVKAEVAAYGLNDADLAEFSSREELDRALRLFDKTALEAGRKALSETGDDKTRNEKGQFAKKEEEQPVDSDGRYRVSLDKDIYDDEIVGEFERMRDHYESRLRTLESKFQEVSVQTEEQKFDSFVDSLGHADLFGKTGKESEKELERRRDLHVAVRAQMIGLERLGRPVELTDQLVSRVANMVYAEDFMKKKLKQQTQKVSKMSNLRLGGSSVKPLPPSDDPRTEADRLYAELSRS